MACAHRVAAGCALNRLLLVGLGGAVGAMLRYAMSTGLLHLSGASAAAPPRFPLATLAVNLLGCLVAGVLAGGIARHDWFTPDVRALLIVGVLGGFTTFSAFGLETLALLRRGDVAMAAVYVAASVLLGLACAGVGWWLATRGL